MEFPSFRDFLNDMGKERLEYWMNAIQEEEIIVPYPDTEEKVREFVEGVLTIAHFATLALMDDYHTWLIKQLQRTFLSKT